MPFRDQCLRNIRISVLLLKKGVKAGLSLYSIGTLLYRKGYSEVHSVIENIIDDAYDLYRAINKSLSSRLKLEKYLSETNKIVHKRRPRAFSSNDIEFEAFLINPQSLNSTQNTADTESIIETVLTISEVSEEDDEEDYTQQKFEDTLEDEENETGNSQNLSFSSSNLYYSERPAHKSDDNEAFNTKLFYYIEAFMDLAIQKTSKELMSKFYIEFAYPGGRIRSLSNALI